MHTSLVRCLLFFIAMFVFQTRTCIAAQFNLLADINKAEDSASFPHDFVESNGQLFFLAQTSTVNNGMVGDPAVSLYVTNGQADGSIELYKLKGGFGTDEILGVIGNKLIFRENNIISSLRTDSLVVQSEYILDTDDPLENYSNLFFTLFENKIFLLHMSRQYTDSHIILNTIIADQNDALTIGVKRINGSLSNQNSFITLANNEMFQSWANKLYFPISSSVSGVGVSFWETDGSEIGTMKTFNAVDLGIALDVKLQHFHLVNGRIIFSAAKNQTSRRNLYSYDLASKQSLNFPTPNNQNLETIFCSASDDKKVYFVDYESDALFVTDGTEGGTLKLKDNSYCQLQHRMNHLFLGGKFLFGSSTELTLTDGTLLGTEEIVISETDNSSKNTGSFIEFNSKVYFSSDAAGKSNFPDNGVELWSLDLNLMEANLITDLNTLGRDSFKNGSEFVVYAEKLFMSATNGITNYELWQLDKDENISLFQDLNKHTLNASSTPSKGISLNDNYYFFADDESRGRELWVFNKIDKITKLVLDFNPGFYMNASTEPFIYDADTQYFNGVYGNYIYVTVRDFTEFFEQMKTYYINNDTLEVTRLESVSCMDELIVLIKGFTCRTVEGRTDGPEFKFVAGNGTSVENTLRGRFSNGVEIDNDLIFAGSLSRVSNDMKLYQFDIRTQAVTELVDIADSTSLENYVLLRFKDKVFVRFFDPTTLMRSLFLLKDNELILIKSTSAELEFLGVGNEGLIFSTDNSLVSYDEYGTELELAQGRYTRVAAVNRRDVEKIRHRDFDGKVYLRQYGFNQSILSTDGSVTGTKIQVESQDLPTTVFEAYPLGTSLYLSTDTTADGRQGNVLKRFDMITNTFDDFVEELGSGGFFPSGIQNIVDNKSGGLFLTMANEESGRELWEFPDDNFVAYDERLIVHQNSTSNIVPKIVSSQNTNSIIVDRQPVKGSLTIENNQFFYTPLNEEFGYDSFEYHFITDSGKSNIAKIEFWINSAPVAVNDSLELTGAIVQFNPLVNDEDNNDTLVLTDIEITTQAQRGSIDFNSDITSLIYTLNDNSLDSDFFEYRVRDDKGEFSNIAKVNISIINSNVEPTTTNDSASTNFETATTINVLVNDSDSDGVLVNRTVTVSTDPTNGTTSVLTNGQITYTPNAGFSGTDSFEYTVQDNNGAVSEPATVTITVRAQVVATPTPPPSSGSGGGGSTSYLFLLIILYMLLLKQKKIRVRFY